MKTLYRWSLVFVVIRDLHKCTDQLNKFFIFSLLSLLLLWHDAASYTVRGNGAASHRENLVFRWTATQCALSAENNRRSKLSATYLAASQHAVLDAGYCYRRRAVAWSLRLSVGRDRKPGSKTVKPIEMSFGADSVGPRNHVLDGSWGCELTPPCEYNGSICPAAAMRAVATINVATCLA